MKSIKNRFKNFVNNKYAAPLIKLLKQGTTPREIALGVAISSVLAVFPVLGSTTILTTGFALLFRLNLPLIQLVNFTVYPIQIALLIPFMKLGEWIFQYAELNYSLSEILNMLTNDLMGTIEMLWWVSMQGIGAWLITAPIVSFILFVILYRVMKIFSKKFKKDVI